MPVIYAEGDKLEFLETAANVLTVTVWSRPGHTLRVPASALQTCPKDCTIQSWVDKNGDLIVTVAVVGKGGTA